MKRVTFVLFFILGVIKIQAQEMASTETVEILLSEVVNQITVSIDTVSTITVKKWTSRGNGSFLFNQSSFNNWMAGGDNNLSGTMGLNYDLNYRREKWSWDNKVIASYGIVKTSTSEYLKKTDDRLEINSILGKEASRVWFYSAFVNFRTQFAVGHLYNTNDAGLETREKHTNFLSPAYLAFGPGMLWKKTNDFKFNLAPLTSKITIVDKSFTLPNAGYFGVDEGKGMRYELGFNAAGYFRFDIMKNVNIENILTLYSNYLEDPQNVDIDYQLNIIMKINKYLTTNFAFQTIYDDNAFSGFQVRQVFGLGVNYAF